MNDSSVAFVFEQAKADALLAVGRLDSKLSRMAVARLLLFFLLVGLVVLLWVEVSGVLAGAIAVLSLMGFHHLIGRYQALEAERARQLRIVDMMEGELESLGHQFSRFEGGASFADPAHPYSADLDLFGEGSLFQMLNRTVSLLGREALGSYFKHPLADREDILERQSAVAELRDAFAFRQNLYAAAESGAGDVRAVEQLVAWLDEPAALQESFYRWAIPLLSIVNIAWLGAFAFLPFYLVLLGYLPTLWLLNRSRPEVGRVYDHTSVVLSSLEQWTQMLKVIEASSWQTTLLQHLRGLFGTADAKGASDQLAALSKDVRQLGVRANPFSVIFQVLWLWDWRYVRRIEARKLAFLAQAPAASVGSAVDFALTANARATDRQLEVWMKSMAAFEALSSFAAAWYRWPHWSLPELVPMDDRIVADAMHHPLIAPARSVGNGFEAASQGGITLLTGSNMAGKSTFLRTVGLHLCMARWGCAVPAKRLICPLLDVHTSMRTQDNLLEGASAFYAELQRLRQVVDALESGAPVFFLLDELLKGTNTDDRHVGGRALIRQLLSLGGAGIIATHDLELAQMSEKDARIAALRLEVLSDADGELFFDYQVKGGIARSRNASALMKRLGLGIAEDEA